MHNAERDVCSFNMLLQLTNSCFFIHFTSRVEIVSRGLEHFNTSISYFIFFSHFVSLVDFKMTQHNKCFCRKFIEKKCRNVNLAKDELNFFFFLLNEIMYDLMYYD